MWRGFNIVVLAGVLADDPVWRVLPESGRPFARFKLRVRRAYRAKTGQIVRRDQWHTVVAWGAKANHVRDWLRKDFRVVLSGALSSRRWKGRDGAWRDTTEVEIADIVFLSRTNAGARVGAPGPASEQPTGDRDTDALPTPAPGAIEAEIDAAARDKAAGLAAWRAREGIEGPIAEPPPLPRVSPRLRGAALLEALRSPITTSPWWDQAVQPAPAPAATDADAPTPEPEEEEPDREEEPADEDGLAPPIPEEEETP